MLFRTHNYDLYAELPDDFLKQVGIKNGFIAELKLFKQDLHNQNWQEFKVNGTPAVVCSFTEDMQNQALKINLQYALDNTTNCK